MERYPPQAVLPLVRLAAEKVIRDRDISGVTSRDLLACGNCSRIVSGEFGNGNTPSPRHLPFSKPRDHPFRLCLLKVKPGSPAQAVRKNVSVGF
ncbi:MAG: hypothetical protein ACQESR_28725 [Planctomycetota bacterium]